MGQAPSCAPPASPDHNSFSLSSAPSSQRMSSSHIRTSHPPSPTHSASSRSISTSIDYSPSPSSPSHSTLRTSPSSPFPHLNLKALSINPELPTLSLDLPFSPPSKLTPTTTSSPSSSTSSLSSFLSSLRSKASTLRRRPFLISTPKGADALTFTHFCPICYRHFPSDAILSTSCCRQNICHLCATQYVENKLPKVMRLKLLMHGRRYDVSCPCCNQHGVGVSFQRVKGQGRSYVESPRTAELMRRVEEARAEQQQGTGMGNVNDMVHA